MPALTDYNQSEVFVAGLKRAPRYALVNVWKAFRSNGESPLM